MNVGLHVTADWVNPLLQWADCIVWTMSRDRGGAAMTNLVLFAHKLACGHLTLLIKSSTHCFHSIGIILNYLQSFHAICSRRNCAFEEIALQHAEHVDQDMVARESQSSAGKATNPLVIRHYIVVNSNTLRTHVWV